MSWAMSMASFCLCRPRGGCGELEGVGLVLVFDGKGGEIVAGEPGQVGLLRVQRDPHEGLVVEAKEAAAEGPEEGDVVEGIVDGPHHVEKVEDFLLAVEAGAGDDIIGDVGAVELAFVFEAAGHAGEEDGDIAILRGASGWWRRPRRLAWRFRRFGDALGGDDCLGGGGGGFIGDWVVRRGGGDEDFDAVVGRGQVALGADGRIVAGHEPGEQVVDELGARDVGAEGHIEIDLLARRCRGRPFRRPRLLPRGNGRCSACRRRRGRACRAGAGGGVVPAGQREKQVELEGVNVLGFIDEELLHAGGEAISYVGIAGDELVGVVEEIGEIEEALRAFFGFVDRGGTCGKGGEGGEGLG